MIRLWYKKLFKFLLEKIGLRQINVNHKIFIIIARIYEPIVNTFIDNIKVIEVKRSGHIEKVKYKLATAFAVVDIGPSTSI